MKKVYAIEYGDKAEAKMGNSNILNLLNELEKLIDFYLQDFYLADLIRPEKVSAAW